MRRSYDSARIMLLPLAVVMVVFLVPTIGKSDLSENERENLVRRLVEAFNNHNVPQMMDLLDDDIQWLTVQPDKIKVEASGKRALEAQMVSYFQSCKSCKSSLDWIESSGERVSAMERASWETNAGVKSQATLSVYEFRRNKIFRVYYFPVKVAP